MPRAKLTQEEKDQRRLEKAQEEEDRERQWPSAWLFHEGPTENIILKLDSGSPFQITVSTIEKDEQEHWCDRWLSIGSDLTALAKFIRALTLRYNTLVHEANEIVNQVPIQEKLNKIEETTPCH